MYKAKTYDWDNFAKGLVTVLRDITDNQVPIYSRTRSEDHKGYPFIVYDLRPHPDIIYSVEKTHEVFDRIISIDCWAESDGEANAIADDLQTLLQDFQYREQLNSYGITLNKIEERDHRSEALASFCKFQIMGSIWSCS